MKVIVTFQKSFEVFDFLEIILSNTNHQPTRRPAGDYTMVMVPNPFGKNVEMEGGEWLVIEGTHFGMSFASVLEPHYSLLRGQTPRIRQVKQNR